MASSRARRSRFLAIALGALMTTLSASALAEPTATEKDTARGLMADGRTKRDANDLKGALKSFIAADAIMQVPSTGWEVARTQEMLGLWVEARDTALRVGRIPDQPHEPPAFQEARTKAMALVDALDAKIPLLMITVKGAAEGAKLTVSIDNSATIPGAALAAPIKVNPGHHVIIAKTETASGTQEIDVLEKEKKDVAVELKPVTDATPTPTPTDTPTDTPPAPPPETKHTMRTVAFVGFGVAGAGLIAGTVTGFLTLSAKSSALDGCRDNRCPPSAFSDLDRASTMATISTVSFIVAGVGAGVGVVALIIGDKPKEPPAATSGMRVTPWIGVGSAGVHGSF
jgi:hypothetical protein